MRFMSPIPTVFAAVILISCQNLQEKQSQLTGYVTYDRSTLWPSKKIPVCWEMSSNITDGDKTIVMDSVKNAYQQAGFEFTGWDDCKNDSRGIRIAEASSKDGFPKTAAFGAFVNGVRSGIKLEFKFESFYPVCKTSSKRREECVAATAVHEFGHALGLRHEANRPDGSCKSFDQVGGQGEDFALPIGAYDPVSIMNYCHLVEIYQKGGDPNLSKGDLDTLDIYYSSANQIPDFSGHCASRGGSWSSVHSCCNITPSHTDFFVSYRPCDPAQQCIFDRGTVFGNCCKLPILPRSNPRYATCP
jgi:hypothetical protein